MRAARWQPLQQLEPRVYARDCFRCDVRDQPRRVNEACPNLLIWLLPNAERKASTASGSLYSLWQHWLNQPELCKPTMASSSSSLREPHAFQMAWPHWHPKWNLCGRSFHVHLMAVRLLVVNQSDAWRDRSPATAFNVARRFTAHPCTMLNFESLQVLCAQVGP